MPASILPGLSRGGTGLAADANLIRELRLRLQEAADPARAPGMQAYMKSTMPYLGVTSTPLQRLANEVFKANPLPSLASWRDTVLELWRTATHREERYAAVHLTGYRLYREYQSPGLLPMYTELLKTGAWWDYVDAVAIHRVGPILRAHPDVVRPLMLRWSTEADMWLRRSAIICQVASKDATDRDLLTRCIDANVDDREFFIRKAIGWALRAYAWQDPRWVADFVGGRQKSLSGLSRREALKNIPRLLGA
jgi:3-methyladenine DNA glycosylase AlkD